MVECQLITRGTIEITALTIPTVSFFFFFLLIYYRFFVWKT